MFILIIFQHTFIYLKHRGSVEKKQGAEIPGDEYSEMHVKKEAAPDSKIPVKHIVAVQSEVQVKRLADELAYREKEWTKPTCELCGQTFKTVRFTLLFMLIQVK